MAEVSFPPPLGISHDPYMAGPFPRPIYGMSFPTPPDLGSPFPRPFRIWAVLSHTVHIRAVTSHGVSHMAPYVKE